MRHESHGSIRPTLGGVSFSRHVRRHAHRVARTPRRAWQRVYTYRVDELPTRPGPGVKVYTPMSRDAPYGDEDAHFWDWTAAVLIIAIVAGFAVWGISAVI